MKVGQRLSVAAVCVAVFGASMTVAGQAPAGAGRQGGGAGVGAPAGAAAQARQGGPGRGRTGGEFGRGSLGTFPTAPHVLQTVNAPIRVVPVVGGLNTPWSVAFLPNGDMLVTERVGQLRLVRANGTLEPTPISGVPAAVAMGQGGLLEVSLHPRFAENRYVYLTYSKAGELGNTTALARGRLDGMALTGVQDLFVADNWSKAGLHFGSKLAWGADGLLYMTVGERNDRTRAQDLSNHGGKVLRLTEDGKPAPGNPFISRAGAKPEIYTYGHRSLQGLAFHPETGVLWETEHGPLGGDELNIIQAGKNYGWPVVTYGREYSGEVISKEPFRADMEQPFTTWTPSLGLSGLAIYSGDKFPGWRGQIFAGGLAGMTLQRVGVTAGGGLAGRESLLNELKLRIRDVRQGPDGFLYVVIDANPGGVLRIEPAPAQ